MFVDDEQDGWITVTRVKSVRNKNVLRQQISHVNEFPSLTREALLKHDLTHKPDNSRSFF